MSDANYEHMGKTHIVKKGASDTPRTEAWLFSAHDKQNHPNWHFWRVKADFARTLERELTASNTALAEARERVKELEERLRLADIRVGFAHNAVKGI